MPAIASNSAAIGQIISRVVSYVCRKMDTRGGLSFVHSSTFRYWCVPASTTPLFWMHLLTDNKLSAWKDAALSTAQLDVGLFLYQRNSTHNTRYTDGPIITQPMDRNCQRLHTLAFARWKKNKSRIELNRIVLICLQQYSLCSLYIFTIIVSTIIVLCEQLYQQ